MTERGNGQPERGYLKDKDALLRRLSRIEGQVRGVRGMVEDEAYRIEVITQLSAVTRALDGVALKLLEEHAQQCVRSAVERGGDEAEERLDEVIETVRRFARTR
jgi:CsoR family transcriptional regulator, copper-sensing transcriptional repressor